jgi:nucleotide-binding universal stress UspA family protein
MWTGLPRSVRTQVTVPDRRCRDVLVAIDRLGPPPVALRDAVTFALEHHAVLTILGLVREPPPMAVQAGYALSWLRREALEDAADQLRELVKSLPAELSIRTVVRCGKPRAELLRLWRHRDYDVVFVAGSRMGPFQPGCRESGPRWASFWLPQDPGKAFGRRRGRSRLLRPRRQGVQQSRSPDSI